MRIKKLQYKPVTIVLLFIFFTTLQNVLAQTIDPNSTSALKRLDLEELMNIEVVSVSKRPEKLTEVASAIQVITQKDIRSSGAKTLPEALKLASNLQVAQVNASQWAISARGFNNVLANKLLVLIDGRSVYTPLYAGVFWDAQQVLLEDIDRIEVISGPGGTLWGANAVNGVVNIITKSAKQTQGIFIEAAAGSNFPGSASLRYGGQIADHLSYRVYGTGFKMDNTLDSNKLNAHDHWSMVQAGFRLDWESSDNDSHTLLQNLYYGSPNPDGNKEAVYTRGDNISYQWKHVISGKFEFQLQAYYDHTWRDFKNDFTEDLKTYDLDLHVSNQISQTHTLSYGLNFRYMDHKVTNLELFQFLPARKNLNLYSAFLQDDITLIRERLKFTIGAKIEHNSYTGLEYQPNGRLSWTPSMHETIWAAVSRAVRTPARIERDFRLNLTPDLDLLSGSENFISENVVSYELGWKTQPLKNLMISVASFYNVYNHIRSSEPGPPPLGIPITFGNGVNGKTYGIELSSTYNLTDRWNFQGGYTLLQKKLSVKPDSKDLNAGTAESNDAGNQFTLQSTLRLRKGFEFGAFLRYIDKLPKPYIPRYVGLDTRIGWHLNKVLELDLIGQNLLKNYHREFIPSSPSPRLMERTVYGRITLRY